MKDLKEELCLQLAVVAPTYLLVLVNMSQFIQTVLLLLIRKLLGPTIWMLPTQNGPDLLVLTAEGHQNKGAWHGGGINLLTAV